VIETRQRMKTGSKNKWQPQAPTQPPTIEA
jgi:hypothetical protein